MDVREFARPAAFPEHLPFGPVSPPPDWSGRAAAVRAIDSQAALGAAWGTVLAGIEGELVSAHGLGQAEADRAIGRARPPRAKKI